VPHTTRSVNRRISRVYSQASVAGSQVARRLGITMCLLALGLLVGSGTSYLATLHVSGGGAVRTLRAALPTRQRSFFVASLRLGRFLAQFQVRPATSGMNSFRVRLLATGSHPLAATLPSVLHLAYNMEYMDMGTTRLIARQVQPGVYVARGAFSMGGPWKINITAGDDTTSVILNVRTQPSVNRPKLTSGYNGPVIQTQLPYGGFVTEMGANVVARLNGGTAPTGPTPHGVDFVPHHPFIYITDMGSDTVQVMNIHTGKVVATIRVGFGPAHVVFTPDATKAFVTDFLSADVSVIDVRHRRLITRIPVGLNPHGPDITPDGRYVYVPCMHGGGVWVIDTRSDHVVATIPTGLEPYVVTMGPPGTELAYVSDAALNQVDVLSLRSHTIIRRIPVGKAPAFMVTAPNGNLYVADHDSNAVTVIFMRTDRVTATIPVGAGPHGMDITPDGRYIYVANNNSNTLSIIATHSGRVIETVHVPGRPNEVALQQDDDLRP
jgi:YVTN family beta-propeller protein